jgi:uncharacterized protein (TIGR03435 family)
MSKKRLYSAPTVALYLISAACWLAGKCAAQGFEVTSVKSVPLSDLRSRYRPLEGGAGSKTPTRVSGVTTLQTMLMKAYGVSSLLISGPSWMATEYYEIAATLPPGVSREQEKIMWQTLLKERFQLEAHRESRQLSIYELGVGRSGPKFKESEPAPDSSGVERASAASGQPRPPVTMGPDGFPQIPADVKMPGSYTLSLSSGEFLRVKVFGRAMTMSELATGITSYAGRLVEDRTGLKGKYDFTLAFETDPQGTASPEGRTGIPAEQGASLSAAVQEQLGLRLEGNKKDVEMLIIDRVQKAPTEN